MPGPSFPYVVGQLLFNGVVNGQKIYSQPNGIGTPVVPQPPAVNPPPNWKNSAYPAYPYAYIGLLSWGCSHFTNTAEIYTVNDPTTDERAALVCCPVCAYLQAIIEPAEEWWSEYFSLWPVGISQPAYKNVEA